MKFIKHFFTPIMLLVFCFYIPVATAIEAFEFDNMEQEQTFHDLTKVLRCPKCQNQNIADSNATLAKDLRNKTYELVKKGQSHDQVVEYMVARYGNFVRYDPPMTPATIFLWLGPLLFILIGFFIIFRMTKKQKKEMPELDEDESARLETLLKDKVGK